MTGRQRFILGLIDFQMRPVTVDEISEALDDSRTGVNATLRAMEASMLVRVVGDVVSFPDFARAA